MQITAKFVGSDKGSDKIAPGISAALSVVEPVKLAME
jgi:hypothetical protein